MSNSTFLLGNVDEIAHPNPCPGHNCIEISDIFDDIDSKFGPSGCHMLMNYLNDDSPSTLASCLVQTNPICQEIMSATESSMSFTEGMTEYSRMQVECNNSKWKNDETEVGLKIAFRTKTLLETLDDGYKWRKYGKKKVKSGPHPRNYYKCIEKGCKVKKTIERDGGNSSYLITTYEGRHNHEPI